MQIDEGIDIVCPDIRVVNGARYRILCNTNIYSLPTKQSSSRAAALDVYNDEPNTCKLAKKSETTQPKEQQKAQFTELPCPRGLHKYVVGRSGTVKKRLENETGTMIDVPRPRDNKDYIRVKYRTEDSLSSLQLRLERVISSARRKEAPTHFVCIPVASEEIGSNLKRFQETCKLDPRMIQIESKLHLTIGVLKCFSPDEIKKATEVLNGFAPKIAYIKRGKPLRAEMGKLEIMNDDPSAANVLYAEVNLSDESSRLQELADQCFEEFVNAGWFGCGVIGVGKTWREWEEERESEREGEREREIHRGE
eukprot:sb/3467154/